MNEFLSKDTGVSMGLMLKVAAAIIAGMLVYTQMAIIGSRQQQRIDAGVIPNVAELMIKDGMNELRFSKIEIQTEDYAANALIFKQMANDIVDIKKVLIK